MLLKHLVVGSIGTNCYLVGCQETKEAAVIDPGGDADRILQAVKEDNLQVKYIINTHGHGDHIQANGPLQKATGAQILIHRLDAECLIDPERSLLAFMGDKTGGPAADRMLEDGHVIAIGTTVKLDVLHTPGHTKGGICLKSDRLIFTGDSLFAGSIGRTDLPGGSFPELIQSIKEKILPLDDQFLVYPGHGPSTTVGIERRENPFLV